MTSHSPELNKWSLTTGSRLVSEPGDFLVKSYPHGRGYSWCILNPNKSFTKLTDQPVIIMVNILDYNFLVNEFELQLCNCSLSDFFSLGRNELTLSAHPDMGYMLAYYNIVIGYSTYLVTTLFCILKTFFFIILWQPCINAFKISLSACCR